MIGAALAFIESCQNDDGGWGYQPGHASAVESTSACALATGSTSATSWLLSLQNDDGGWGLGAFDEESGWQTAWAVLALKRTVIETDAVSKGIQWLASSSTLKFYCNEEEQERDPVLNIDLRLHGWPWLPGQSSWVEPTALSLLALHGMPLAQETEAKAEEAVRYLLDRRCQNGGWNFGNPYMFVPFPARAQPTAFALLALATMAPSEVLEQDIAVLRQEALADGGPLAQGLAGLALSALGERPDRELARLETMQAKDGSWDGNPFHTAIAVLALQGDSLL